MTLTPHFSGITEAATVASHGALERLLALRHLYLAGHPLLTAVAAIVVAAPVGVDLHGAVL